jgi:hypothetical protein
MLGLRVRGALGQVPLTDPLELDRLVTRRARFLDRNGGQLDRGPDPAEVYAATRAA